MQSGNDTKSIEKAAYATNPAESAAFVAQAKQLRKDADQLELDCDFHGSAYGHLGAAVFYGKAYMTEESKQSWGLAADMFAVSIISSFGPAGGQEKLSVDDWRNVLRRAKEVVQASINSGARDGLKAKYEGIMHEVRKSLEQGIIPNWERLMG